MADGGRGRIRVVGWCVVLTIFAVMTTPAPRAQVQDPFVPLAEDLTLTIRETTKGAQPTGGSGDTQRDRRLYYSGWRQRQEEVPVGEPPEWIGIFLCGEMALIEVDAVRGTFRAGAWNPQARRQSETSPPAAAPGAVVEIVDTGERKPIAGLMASHLTLRGRDTLRPEPWPVAKLRELALARPLILREAHPTPNPGRDRYEQQWEVDGWYVDLPWQCDTWRTDLHLARRSSNLLGAHYHLGVALEETRRNAALVNGKTSITATTTRRLTFASRDPVDRRRFDPRYDRTWAHAVGDAWQGFVQWWEVLTGSR